MTSVKLIEFIKTGCFGTITIGSTKEEVLKELGNNLDIIDCGETHIIYYGWYEFFYWTTTELIFGIQNDHLQANCTNHGEMINFQNNKFKLDNWFLKENKNINFGQVEEVLISNNIEYEIIPTWKGCDENIIRCVRSNVTFDFVREYRSIDLSNNWKEQIETEQSKFILNGIRLFE